MGHKKSKKKNKHRHEKQEHSKNVTTASPQSQAPLPPKEVYKTSLPQGREPIVKKPLAEIDPERMKRAERYIEQQTGLDGNRKRRIIVHEFPGEDGQPTQIVVNKKPRLTPFGSASEKTQSTTPSRYLKNIREEIESMSDISSDFYPSASYRQTKKLLSGFHPYYDEESDVMALQCSTCCIGCWRNCSHRCTGCENFLSCPIYCWMGVIFPLFLLLLAGLLITGLYASGVIK